MKTSNTLLDKDAEESPSPRLHLLAAMEAGLSSAEALSLALQQATAGLGGLGALAHTRRGTTGRLSLLAAEGITRTAAEPWAALGEEDDAAPARAAREGGFVWVPGGGLTIGDSGMASVPLLGVDGPVGALSVITAGGGEPTAVQRSFLRWTATWAIQHADLSVTTQNPADTSRERTPPQGDEAVLALIRDMGEAVLTVDDAWRITYANDFAERLLASDRRLLGDELWEVPAARVPGLEVQCRRASAEGKTVEFDLPWPSDRGLRRVRVVPVRDRGQIISLCDAVEPVPTEVGQNARTQARDRLASRMSELTMALAEALTSKDVVRAVADHVRPAFGADGVAVEALEGVHIRVVDAVGYNSEFLRLFDRLPLNANSAVTDVLRTRTPRFVESPAEFVRLYPNLEYMAAASPKRAWAFLPLIASGHAIGCCVVSFSRPHTFGEEERVLLTALSGMVAQALERARLYDAEHTRAQGLQRGLLPQSLPSLPAVSAAARYLPAGRGDEVGGDWYDVIRLSSGRVAMVIGDVMGHGIAEAATMGRLRTAVRTLADLDMDPDELLSHLNSLVSDLGDDYYATCLYAVFDPVTQRCSFSVAGHPPPLIILPDGTVRCPELTLDPPLGAAEPPFETLELTVPDDSLLVFCTDGLVESATRDMDQGLAELGRILADAVTDTSHVFAAGPDAHDAALERLCEAAVSGLVPDQDRTADDAALLIVHTRGMPADDVASLRLPEDPRAAAEAREYVRGQLARWHLDDLVMTTELLVSELVGNVIRHARGPIQLRLLRGPSLICEVYDGSLTSPRIRRAGFNDEGGRGLHLVAAVSQRWGTRFLGDGKCIWAEQDLPDSRTNDTSKSGHSVDEPDDPRRLA